jgi:arylsulfatase
MKTISKFLLAGSALCPAGLCGAPPNIIIILMDDMGLGDLTLTGASGYQTPDIDRLAKEGMFFSHYYSAQPVSSASRAGLMTGCYPNRIGFSGALGPQAQIGIHSDEETIAEMLKQKGYACGMVGKWHLGSKPPFLPLQNGFDEYLGLPYSNDMWPVDYEGNRVTETSGLPNKRGYPPLPLIDGNEKVRELWTLDEQSELTTLYTERAVAFIKNNRKKPFFLYVAHSMPHVPLAVSSKFKGKSQQGLYGDVLMEINWSVKEILATVKAQKLEDNTLIILTSDNGPWLNFGNHAGSAGGLREGKTTSFEGGLHVPCLMKWKGVIPEGVVCNGLVSAIDILPTLAEIVAAPPSGNKIDGVSILPLMKGATETSPRKHFLYYYRSNNLEAVRNERFKLVFPHRYDSYLTYPPGADGFPGKRGKEDATLSLYDLRRDPGERYDVKELYPEVVQQLSDIADNARQDLGDDLTDMKGANRRKAGTVK